MIYLIASWLVLATCSGALSVVFKRWLQGRCEDWLSRIDCSDARMQEEHAAALLRIGELEDELVTERLESQRAKSQRLEARAERDKLREEVKALREQVPMSSTRWECPALRNEHGCVSARVDIMKKCRPAS